MWARVARYEVEPERIDAAVEGFEAAATGLAELKGTRGGFLLIDRDDGSAVTVTLWESWDSMCASEVRAAALRRQAMEGAQGSVSSVGLYEVAAEFGNGSRPAQLERSIASMASPALARWLGSQTAAVVVQEESLARALEELERPKAHANVFDIWARS